MGTADRRKVMRADDAKDGEGGSVSKRREEEFAVWTTEPVQANAILIITHR